MITEGKGLGFTSSNLDDEVCLQCEYKGVGIAKQSHLFGINKILSKREFLPLLDIAVPHTLIPREFIALIKGDTSFEEIINKISERNENTIVNQILQEERYSLREERKRPWSKKTRRPFRGRLDKLEITLETEIKIAEEVVEELGAPFEKSKRGRPPIYDAKKLAASLLAKGMNSFVTLAAELKKIDYNMTIDGSKKYPCPSELHHVFEKIPSEWLKKAVQRIDELSVENYSKFGENLDIFVIDGSAITCETLVEKKIAMKGEIHREYQKYLAVTRTVTNTARCIKNPTNKIKDIIPYLPLGSILLGDPEFDVEENYRDAYKSGLELHIKQKKGNPRKSYRKKARRDFESKKYRMRKLGERYFGNLESRRYKCYFKKPENRHKFSILIACKHNIRAYFKNKAWCDMFVRLS